MHGEGTLTDSTVEFSNRSCRVDSSGTRNPVRTKMPGAWPASCTRAQRTFKWVSTTPDGLTVPIDAAGQR